MEKALLELRDLRLLLRDHPDERAIALLERTVWGSEGGANYLHLGTRDKIRATPNAYWMTLEKGDQLLGNFTFVGRNAFSAGVSYPSWYIRYFSLAEHLRVKGKRETEKPMRADNFLRKAASRIFQDPSDLKIHGVEDDRAVFYAFVELTNARSQEMCASMGFQPLRKFNTTTFSRFYPKPHARVERTQAKDHAEVLEKTTEFYKDHSLFFSDHILMGNQHFVYRENGKIVAGVQAHPAHWVVDHLPGFTGNLIVKIAPYIPFLRRVFNPKSFRFVAFEGLFHLPGKEQFIPSLLESVLALMGHRAGLLWLDTEDPLQATLKKVGRLGVLNKLKDDLPADVIGRFHAIPDQEVLALKNKPIYISGYDPV